MSEEYKKISDIVNSCVTEDQLQLVNMWLCNICLKSITFWDYYYVSYEMDRVRDKIININISSRVK